MTLEMDLDTHRFGGEVAMETRFSDAPPITGERARTRGSASWECSAPPSDAGVTVLANFPDRHGKSAAAVEAIWTEEFDGLYDMPGTFRHPTPHVQVIGHPGRPCLAKRHIKSRPGRAFLTAQQVAVRVS